MSAIPLLGFSQEGLQSREVIDGAFEGSPADSISWVLIYMLDYERQLAVDALDSAVTSWQDVKRQVEIVNLNTKEFQSALNKDLHSGSVEVSDLNKLQIALPNLMGQLGDPKVVIDWNTELQTSLTHAFDGLKAQVSGNTLVLAEKLFRAISKLHAIAEDYDTKLSDLRNSSREFEEHAESIRKKLVTIAQGLPESPKSRVPENSIYDLVQITESIKAKKDQTEKARKITLDAEFWANLFLLLEGIIEYIRVFYGGLNTKDYAAIYFFPNRDKVRQALATFAPPGSFFKGCYVLSLIVPVHLAARGKENFEVRKRAIRALCHAIPNVENVSGLAAALAGL